MDPGALSNLRAQYAEYASEYLLDLAWTAFTDLVPDARHALADELARRNAFPALQAILTRPARRLDVRESSFLVGLVQRLPCPKCGTTRTLLNGEFREVREGIGIAMRTRYVVEIGCQICLKKTGWFRKQLQPGQPWRPTGALESWVEQNAPFLDGGRSNPEALAALVRFDWAEFVAAIEAGSPPSP